VTLLEAILAFVLLSVVGVVCLDQTRGATQLQVRSAEWTDAVARAESAMSAATAGSLPGDAFGSISDRRDDDAIVARAPWRAGLDRIVVTIPLASGGTYVLERLVPVASGGGR